MKKTLILIALTCVVFTVSAQDQRPLVLVFDFDTTHLSDDEMIVLVDYVASNLLNTGQYRVIDRRQREEALKEIAFSNSDLSGEALRLKVGEFLAADFMLLGSIGAIGDRFLLNLKLVDVNTAETIRTASERYADINDLIDDSARLTVGLIGATRTTPQTSPRPPAATASPPQQGLADTPAAAQVLPLPGGVALGPFVYSEADGVFLHTSSGLMWTIEFSEDLTYAEAEAHVSTLTVGGYRDWRIPEAAEMAVLGNALMGMAGQPELGRTIQVLGSESEVLDFRGDTINTFWTQTPSAGGGKMTAVDLNVVLLPNNRPRRAVGRQVNAKQSVRLEIRAVRDGAP